jgi:hypothetical protein
MTPLSPAALSNVVAMPDAPKVTASIAVPALSYRLIAAPEPRPMPAPL